MRPVTGVLPMAVPALRRGSPPAEAEENAAEAALVDSLAVIGVAGLPRGKALSCITGYNFHTRAEADRPLRARWTA